ncbi:MAG: N-6 DNA methylase [Polyangiaceae bacterium]|nr:N-6 DNA methylase [Polyangiaceae bacterium]
MPTVLTNDAPLADLVRAYGCADIVPLTTSRVNSPNQIPYLDLLAKHVRDTAALLPVAVAEFQGRPVMYFLDGRTGEPDSTGRLELQHRLANRGDHAVLAVVRPGDLTLHPLNLNRELLNKHGLGRTIRAADANAPFIFHSIATGSFKLKGQPEDVDPVFRRIQELLELAVEDLVETRELDGMDVLSMTGRALFFRFLIDRRIVEADDLQEICPAALAGPKPHDLKAVFSTPERAAQTSTWLDQTFNGDLLPLVNTLNQATSPTQRQKAYEEAYADAGARSENLVFRHLEAILRGWKQIRSETQLTLPIDWDDLNFRHIPIGVLSQVYEDFSHKVDPHGSRDRSVHYTPRALAKLLVEQALAGVDAPHNARILDPSCGAGVFLVLALRELVRLRWEHDIERLRGNARRPNKAVIQAILHQQVRGFDISESALRLAALALYITVIELNEITRPPSEHHAGKALKDLVLFDKRTDEEKREQDKKKREKQPKGDDKKPSGFVLGSLGDTDFNNYFHVVVGNPPWTRLKDDGKSTIDSAGTRIARRVLKDRKLEKLAKGYKNPGGVPDLPFLWRAMEWLTPDGIMGFALDARLILSPSGPIAKARNALMQAVSVTGILNGSDLEETPVWPGMKMPWILMWARNEKPALEEHAFHIITPVREDELARNGKFRLDFQSAYTVPVKKVIEYGWLCKALAIGTTLDAQVMEKMVIAAKRQSISHIWGQKDGKLPSNRGLDIKPLKATAAPEWLLELEVFNDEDPGLFSTKCYPTYRNLYGDRRPNNTRKIENFYHPLTLFRRAPGETRESTKSVRLCGRNIAFSKNYFGYSASNHSESDMLIALLHLFAHSSLFQHFTYMFSAQIGARRRIIDKKDIDAFPFPILEELSEADRKRAVELADALDTHSTKDWDAIDTFVCKLFGLTKAEQQVVEDTVKFNGPYRVVRKRAAQPTPTDEVKTFASTLEKSLQPFFRVAGQRVRAAVVPPIEGKRVQQPWRFVTLLLDGDSWTPSPTLIADIMAEATKTSASRVVMPLPEGGLMMGLINKRRFWTRSRARLCALHIAHEQLEKCFPLGGDQ